MRAWTAMCAVALSTVLAGAAVTAHGENTAYLYNVGYLPAFNSASPQAACNASMAATQAQMEQQYPSGCSRNECVSCTETNCDTIRSGPSCPFPVDFAPYHQSLGIARTEIPVEGARNACAPPFCAAGNPINQATGNKFQIETDYIGAGPFPLRFERYYNSKGTGISTRVGTW